MKLRKKFYAWLVVTLLIMAAIFMFSSQDADASRKLSGGLIEKIKPYLGDFAESLGFSDGKLIRKWAHFFEYTCLGFSGGMLWREVFRKKSLLRPAAYNLLGGILYAASDEIHQIFVPGRSCELRDIVIDFAGIVLGTAVCTLCFYIYYRKTGVSSDG